MPRHGVPPVRGGYRTLAERRLGRSVRRTGLRDSLERRRRGGDERSGSRHRRLGDQRHRRRYGRMGHQPVKAARDRELAWRVQPRAVQIYALVVTAAGAFVLFLTAPRTLPAPGLLLLLLIVAVVTSAWKVNLPIPLASGSTLSVSYAA